MITRRTAIGSIFGALPLLCINRVSKAEEPKDRLFGLVIDATPREKVEEKNAPKSLHPLKVAQRINSSRLCYGPAPTTEEEFYQMKTYLQTMMNQIVQYYKER